jgi:hypothetical protein
MNSGFLSMTTPQAEQMYLQQVAICAAKLLKLAVTKH